MLKRFQDFVDELQQITKYTPKDFVTSNDKKQYEIVQYVIDNIEDFDKKYREAKKSVERQKRPLRLVDRFLYEEICETMEKWCEENNENFYSFDVDAIFDKQ